MRMSSKSMDTRVRMGACALALALAFGSAGLAGCGSSAPSSSGDAGSQNAQTQGGEQASAPAAVEHDTWVSTKSTLRDVSTPPADATWQGSDTQTVSTTEYDEHGNLTKRHNDTTYKSDSANQAQTSEEEFTHDDKGYSLSTTRTYKFNNAGEQFEDQQTTSYKNEYDDQGRWLADYIMDSMDKATAKVVKKVTVDGTAYSTNGIDGPYEAAIMANGTILGKYIQAHSVTAEQIDVNYTKQWQDADEQLNTTMTSLISGPNGIEAKVSTLRGDVFGDSARGVKGLKADLEAAIKVNADNISLTVRKDGIQSAINQSADRIIVNASKFGWTSDYSSLTDDGTLTTKNMVATNARITGVLTTENSNGTLKTQMEAGIIKLYANNTVAGNIQGFKSSDGKYNTRIYGKNGVIISTGSGTITLDANKLVAGGYTGYTGWVNGVYYSCGLRTTRT